MCSLAVSFYWSLHILSLWNEQYQHMTRQASVRPDTAIAKAVTCVAYKKKMTFKVWLRVHVARVAVCVENCYF